MKVKESIEIMKAHNAWRRNSEDEIIKPHAEWRRNSNSSSKMQNPKDVEIAARTLISLAESLKITDDSPIVGRRYKQRATGIIGEVKVIGIGGGHVIYRMARKGFGAQLCACKDFLRHFDFIENKK